ncbi:MAG: tRNA (adenosine(37)-N6)-dimethylallyltransferase MiaA [Salibacteraceae bacterium]
MKKLVVITGPTASGKTAISVDIAKSLNTEIISCDSRQFYKEMSIGTAKPSKKEMDGVVHHFVNSHSISEELNAGRFERESLLLINDLFKKHDYVVMCGGSGLFIDAVTKGFDDMPSIIPEVRDLLRKQFKTDGISSLKNRLKELDPEYYAQVDLDNSQRVIRALEICLSSNTTYSNLRKGQLQKRPFETIKIVLDWPRETLYSRINKRVDEMLNEGLINEVKSLLPFRDLNALNTVGYKEFFEYLDGQTTLEKAIELVKRNSRRYAKRQLTWFRRDPSYHWITDISANKILEIIKKEPQM